MSKAQLNIIEQSKVDTASTAGTSSALTMMHVGKSRLSINDILNSTDKDILLAKGIDYLNNLKTASFKDFEESSSQIVSRLHELYKR